MSCRKQRISKLGVSTVIYALFVGQWALGATQITSVDFNGTSDPSEIIVQGNGPLQAEKQDNLQDKQIILEIRDANISQANSRRIDTSSFKSRVSLISPYQVEGQKDTVRVVVQLREEASAELVQQGNQIRLKIPNGGDTAGVSTEVPALATPSLNEASTPTSLSDSSSKSRLDEFMDNRSQMKFTGKPITLQLRDADVKDVLRLIGEASGFNIVVGDDVKGKLTLSLTDVPWDQALDVVLHTLKLGAERNHNILRVVTLQSLTKEKQEELKAAEAAAASTPRITRVFPISYADLNELQQIIAKFGAANSPSNLMPGSSGASGATGGLLILGAPGAPGTPGSGSIPGTTSYNVQVDNRTNSIIVRDIPENIERIKKLIEILDTQTPQVMIEAKVIEATEGFSKNLSGNLGFGGTNNTSFLASFAGGNPVDSLIGSPGVYASGSAVAQASSPTSGIPNGTFGISPQVSFIPGVSRINAILSWGESENQVKIVSSPKTVVLNKQKANIVQGTPVLVPGTTTVAGVGTVATTTVQSANVSLSVKPTVTNDGSVLLDLTVTKDVPMALPGGNYGIGNRNINTQVLVDSGTTLVIGGIYTMQTNHTSAGFPFLRKIPILGALFGSDTESTDRSELFIFVTPRIINSKEAGMSGA